jgi:hypothetical protein
MYHEIPRWRNVVPIMSITYLRWLGNDIAEIIFSKFISGPVLKKNKLQINNKKKIPPKKIPKKNLYKKIYFLSRS